MNDNNLNVDEILSEYDKKPDAQRNKKSVGGFFTKQLDVNEKLQNTISENKKPEIAAENSTSHKNNTKTISNTQTHSNKKKISHHKKRTLREKYGFLFQQLVRRDFKSKYKQTILGVIWSMLSPLVVFTAQSLIFTVFFGRTTPHYPTYLITGIIVYSYFTDATKSGMFSLVSNGVIISKINVPKNIFLLSKNVACLLNFVLTLIILFVIAIFDGINFNISFILLLYPIICLMIFNVGMGYILSALYVFYRDTQYLYGIFTQLLMYFSAVFYTVDKFGEEFRHYFFINPLYCYISYFRTIIIDNQIPSLALHGICIGYALAVLLIGVLVYKKNNNKFVYYF